MRTISSSAASVGLGWRAKDFGESITIDKDENVVRIPKGQGTAPGHPKELDFQIHVLNREHPITRGVNDFVVTDEQHYVTYDKDPKYVLARSVNENGLDYTDSAGRRSNSSESVWAYDYGKGRVCYLAPGHLLTVLWNPEYVKLQKNAVRWLLRLRCPALALCRHHLLLPGVAQYSCWTSRRGRPGLRRTRHGRIRRTNCSRGST